ncbi:YkgJ family cysteine cluster protein [Pleionea litopenaei]|uniref:YkgJ family cysteine cluster protein n=1 Tax=Pleionea litopenaei TaxID=3070815 RepID=A0AA51RUC8_9GAMM|nr:YkgJ family cysteine cluster protein [Pleionea sp. HL-JVS1]WMS87828.1 YkgJ family cysteine cluster protein [Pleionea sp. HL-JVS1]
MIQLSNLDCQSCGACCAHYRVSFYNGECDFTEQGRVPTDLVKTVNPFMVCMSGTQLNPPRCVALNGEVGSSVSCNIYEKRSSACRNFEAGSEACFQARVAHGINIDDLQIA